MRNAALTGRVKALPPSGQPLSNHICPSLPNCTCCPKRDLADPPSLSCRVQDLTPAIQFLSRVNSTALSRSRAQLVAVQRLWLLMRLDIDSLKSGLSGETILRAASAFAHSVQGSRILTYHSVDSRCVWRGPRPQAALRSGVTLYSASSHGA